MVKLFSGTVYNCDCGYETLSVTGASTHSRTKKCKDNIMNKKEMRFVSKGDYDRIEVEPQLVHLEQIETLSALVSTKDGEIDKLNKIIREQRETIMKISEKMPLDEDEDDEIGSGIIYYITDKDMPSRGKIGRTKNTDIKKLKCRYSTFSKPCVFCFYSTDIKKDENDLKMVLKENGCMDATIGKETVHNSPDTMRIFHEFANR